MKEIQEQNQKLQETMQNMMQMFTGMREEIDDIKETQARRAMDRTSRSRSRSSKASPRSRSRSRSRRSRHRSRGRSLSTRRERSQSGSSWPPPGLEPLTSSSANWADIMDAEEAARTSSKLVAVSEETEATLKECFTQWLKHPERISIRDRYGLPKVLDATIGIIPQGGNSPRC